MRVRITALFLSVFFSLPILANLDKAPPSLEIGRKTQGIFVDFKSAKSMITYDLNSKKAYVYTRIEFFQPVKGYALFDLIENPTEVLLDGNKVSTSLTTMKGISKLRYIERESLSGNHVLEVKNPLKKYIVFSRKSVRSAFWMSDLSDRRFLEQFLPSNLEYDQYKIDFEVKVLGDSKEQLIYTNGHQKLLGRNHFSISYPKHFTASSLYFHMVEKGQIPEVRTTFKSIDGRNIPVIVYTEQSLSRFKNSTLSI